MVYPAAARSRPCNFSDREKNILIEEVYSARIDGLRGVFTTIMQLLILLYLQPTTKKAVLKKRRNQLLSQFFSSMVSAGQDQQAPSFLIKCFQMVSATKCIK